jgi:E3 ubiquitin-protein ligase UHRF1
MVLIKFLCETGAESILVGLGANYDKGDQIEYVGSGGKIKNGKLTQDQTWKGGNLALLLNEKNNIPVRVIRSWQSGSRYNNHGREATDIMFRYAPTTGFRYDGLYNVISHREDKTNEGFTIIKFILEAQETGPNTPWYQPPVHALAKRRRVT